MTTLGYCVVLGASGGIGESISRALAASGWSLYLHYNENAGTVLRLQEELQAAYPSLDFRPIQGDLSQMDGADLARQVKQVRAVVVANGQSMYKLLSETTAEDMDDLWKVHVRNPARFIAAVSPQLRSFGTAYVVMIGSIWGMTGAAGEVLYSAVKGAQHAFVKAYAKEAAFSGIRVNGVAPGWIDTRMNGHLPEDERQMAMEEIPLMKPGIPDHVAQAVDYLLSGKADYTTGDILNVNGGWYT
ncbi:3-oxoacyl-[acyl-carrier-protein] reductase [Bacillus sp. OxB-1]|uniref:elongation factor P 5-aminopentanone reductase n=1 Tax=Bacillus sp. (strain OxB-1) TaxID=98228 RepID=UPI0005821A0E|nr:SDR family oxidoreductase [Bacillus sp. OxB-1]BAQ10583.1 3-oxoacyl-[acyl-carrier-protein] reductase [Bacillus sp. OxB-1]